MKFPSIPDDTYDQPGISFNTVDVTFPEGNQEALSEWLTAVAKTFDREIQSLSYVLCSDDYLIELNIERLAHDTYTDIITFDLGDSSSRRIDAECYISIDRIRENAVSFNEPFDREFRRVLVHGLLHLCGFSDKSEVEISSMRLQEDIALRSFDLEYS